MNNSIVQILSYLLIISYNNALVPETCRQNVSSSKICCPVNLSFGTVCGYPYRGFCQKIEYPEEIIPEIFQIDERIYWPSRFFTSHCKCLNNFFGVSCEECQYGWTGANCNQRKILIRRNILSFSTDERKILQNVLRLSLETNSNYVIPVEMNNLLCDPLIDPQWISTSVQYKKVFDHRFAGRSTLFDTNEDCELFGNVMDFNHNGIGFATWHRYMIMHWERELGKIALRHFGITDFALPYWDWTDLKYCDICSNDLVGSEGYLDIFGGRLSRYSTFYNWTEFCSEPLVPNLCYGCHYGGQIGKITRRWNNLDFPSLEELEFTLGQSRFYSADPIACDSLHKTLEGFCGVRGPLSISPVESLFMHNKIHNMIDGSMCCSATSVNDPLFILHHVQVDRIFQAWFRIHQPSIIEYPLSSAKPGHNRHSFLVSFFPIVSHGNLFTDVSNLGYTYDTYDFTINRRRLLNK